MRSIDERKGAGVSALETADINRIPHGAMLKIRAVYDALKSAERKAVDYILTHPDEISTLTIVQLADEAGCSEATIVRLAKRLGYDGFPALKADFARVEADHDDLPYEGLSRSDPPRTVLHKVMQSTIQALHDTLDVIDEEQYEAALRAILSADKLMFCGLGDAGLVALEAQQRFVRVGKPCLATLDADLQLIYATQLGPGDVLVAISHSGRSRTIVDTVRRAKDSGATVIAITNFPVSPLSKKADIVLLTAVFTKYVTGEVGAKRVTEISILESLSINYAIQRGDSAIAQLQASNRAVDINKI